jgi:O-antigen/teichoic acid export membrane protein
VVRKKLSTDISANGFQVIIYQATGILVFYFCSIFLDKKDLGEINWSVALLYTLFSILGFGIDQVAVRKIAAGHSPVSLMKLYLSHVLFTGLLFYLLLLAGDLLFKDFFRDHYLLIVIGLCQFLLFLSTPFKQIAAGKEKFRQLMGMSTCSNIVKAAGVLGLAVAHRLTLRGVIGLFVAGAVMELFLCIYLSRDLLQRSAGAVVDKKAYRNLILESLPQLGSVIFNAALARFDWILLGLISTSVILAEYSFAYKVFEISTLPLLALGPLLLPKFTRLFPGNATDLLSEGAVPPDLLTVDKDLLVLLRVEMIIASFIALLLNMLWEPFIDRMTGGKYGGVNIGNILILSSCMPFLYLNNFLWALNFARGRLKAVFFISMIAFLVNLSGDIVLIPLYQGFGAAIAYAAAMIVQTILYTGITGRAAFYKAWTPLLCCAGSAVLSGLLARHFFPGVYVRTAISILVYFVLLLAARQLRPADWRILKLRTGL